MKTTPLILVIDDEKGICDFFQRLLTKKGYVVYAASTGKQASGLFETHSFKLVLLDLKLPDTDGLSLLKHFKEKDPSCPIIIITAFGTISSAVEAIQMGAYDYLEKPFTDIQNLLEVVRRALDKGESPGPKDEKERSPSVAGFVVGKSPTMHKVKQLAEVLAPKDITILIEGETGTGKEVLARYIHSASRRANESFIAVNCGAFTESLLESELFGHEKGSFTGATNQRQGIFEVANYGTLFLDEISEASLNVQVKLLRVLESGEYYRIGGKECLKSNARIIAASNINLEKAVDNNRFRKDLFYRLDVARLYLPPLRERPEDIPVLVEHFIQKHSPAGEKKESTKEAMELLTRYPWPGNIRELSNVIAHTMALAAKKISPEHLPEKILHSSAGKAAVEPMQVEPMQVEPMQKKGCNDEPYDEPYMDKLCSSFTEELTSHLAKELKNKGSLDLPQVMHTLKTIEGEVAFGIVKEALGEALGDRQNAAYKLNINTRSLRYLLKEKKHRK